MWDDATAQHEVITSLNDMKRTSLWLDSMRLVTLRRKQDIRH